MWVRRAHCVLWAICLRSSPHPALAIARARHRLRIIPRTLSVSSTMAPFHHPPRLGAGSSPAHRPPGVQPGDAPLPSPVACRPAPAALEHKVGAARPVQPARKCPQGGDAVAVGVDGEAGQSQIQRPDGLRRRCSARRRQRFLVHERQEPPPGRVASRRHHLRLRTARTARAVRALRAVRPSRPLQFHRLEAYQHRAPIVGVEAICRWPNCQWIAVQRRGDLASAKGAAT